jgi:hypothetical protein
VVVDLLVDVAVSAAVVAIVELGKVTHARHVRRRTLREIREWREKFDRDELERECAIGGDCIKSALGIECPHHTPKRFL